MQGKDAELYFKGLLLFRVKFPSKISGLHVSNNPLQNSAYLSIKNSKK